MELRPGTQLLHYRLAEKLGEGGMGVVWRAVDTSLDRDVAIKVLPDIFANDPDRAARFEREAKLLAALNHTGIAAVHSVHESDGTRFLAMELVPGQDLAARVAKGPLPLDEALDIAKQIAEALETAHEQGIVHRDLKPANVVVTPDGRVKILDFGLAKALDVTVTSGTSGLSKSPTMTSAGTQAGMILGTAAYMSPEQARGKTVDRRADIWAFGCVLYEMLTGRQAFDGETVTDILAAVVTRDPDWNALPSTTPARVRDLLHRCLEKDPRKRMRDAGEIRIALDDAIANPRAESAAATTAAPSRRSRGRLFPWIIAGVATVLALTMSRRGGNDDGQSVSTRLSIPVAAGDVIDGGIENAMLAISPDGRTVAYAGRHRGTKHIYVRRLGDGEAEELAGTEGANSPFFSPDGEWIAFVAHGQLFKIKVDGGPTFELCDSVLADRSGVWMEDGSIVLAISATKGLVRIPGGGGTPVAVTTLNAEKRERTHRWPDALPGGEWIVFTVGTVESPGDYDKATIAAVSLKTGERRDLFQGAAMARYAPPGYLILARRGVLMAAHLDPENPQPITDPVPITDRIASEPSSGVAHFAVSRSGTLVLVPELGGDSELKLVWFDRNGTIEDTGAPPRPYSGASVSPDGKLIVATVGTSFRNGDIWTFDVARKTSERITFTGTNVVALFTPDQRKLVYLEEGEKFNVQVRDLGAGAQTRLVYASPVPLVLDDVTPAGHVLFHTWGSFASDVMVIPIAGGTDPVLVASGSNDQTMGRVSPDGKWLAYESRETGAIDIYVRPFPDGTEKWQVSTEGGCQQPLWSPSGNEIFWTRDAGVYVTTVESREDGLAFGTSRRLCDLPLGRRSDTDLPLMDIAPDGKRFLTTSVANPELMRRRIDVVLNWSADLKAMEKKGVSR